MTTLTEMVEKMRGKAEEIPEERTPRIGGRAGQPSAMIKQGLASAGIPQRFMNANIFEFSEAFGQVAESENVYVYGSQGIGKTHFLCACLKQYLQNEIEREYNDPDSNANISGVPEIALSPPMYFITAPELMLQFKQSYNKDASETETQVLAKYAKAKFLALDDLGVERISDWSIQMLYLLIDRRYREMKRTLISSNMSLSEIARKFDNRIASRIVEMCEVIKIEGNDRRVQQNHEEADK